MNHRLVIKCLTVCNNMTKILGTASEAEIYSTASAKNTQNSVILHANPGFISDFHCHGKVKISFKEFVDPYNLKSITSIYQHICTYFQTHLKQNKYC